MYLLSSAYLPPIEWFARLASGDAVIEACDHYVKQTYRNRCHIATPQGPLALTVPTSGPPHATGISDQASWRHVHWQSMVSAYRMSPFFEYYADDLRPFYDTPRTETLHDFNMALVATLCRLMHIDPPMRFTTEYLTPGQCAERGIADLRTAIHPKRPPTLATPPYYQVFAAKTGFLPNLSVADLLFNLGPEAALYLNALNNT